MRAIVLLGSDLDEIADDGVQKGKQERVHIFVDKIAMRKRASKIFQSGEDESEVVNCFYTERSESEAMIRGDIQEQNVVCESISRCSEKAEIESRYYEWAWARV